MTTEKKNDIDVAIFELRKEVAPIMSDRTNPMYKSDYATIFQIMKTLDPLFSKYGLVFFSTIDRLEDTWGVLSVLRHVESSTEVRAFFPADRIADAQQMGKLLTYARRYNLAALLNLCFENDKDDDDGNGLLPGKKTVKRVEPKPLNNVMAAL